MLANWFHRNVPVVGFQFSMAGTVKGFCCAKLNVHTSRAMIDDSFFIVLLFKLTLFKLKVDN
jgi:hypothetical protein